MTIVALGDTFQERIDDLAGKLKKEKNIDIPADKRFVGLDAYKQVIDSGVDVVIIATPPYSVRFISNMRLKKANIHSWKNRFV